MYIFAVVMSKLEGTGLEKEQMVQIHVAPPSLGLEPLDTVIFEGLNGPETCEILKLREALFIDGCSLEASSLPSLADWTEERWTFLG